MPPTIVKASIDLVCKVRVTVRFRVRILLSVWFGVRESNQNPKSRDRNIRGDLFAAFLLQLMKAFTYILYA